MDILIKVIIDIFLNKILGKRLLRLTCTSTVPLCMHKVS